MRRILVIVTAVALLVAALPSVASAHRSTRESDSHTSLFCELIPNEQGTIGLFAEISQQYGGYASLVYWELPALPDEAPPTWYSWEGQASLSEDGSQLSALLDMYEYVEEPMPEEPIAGAVPPPDPELFVGQAEVSATLTPVGDPQPYSYESSGTNFRYRVEGVVQEYSVAGTAALPGEASFDLGSCMASTETYSFFGTNPNAFVSKSDGASLGCSWESESYTVFLNGYREGDWSNADLFISDLTGEYYGFSEAVMTDTSFSSEFLVFAPETEPEPEGVHAEAVPLPDEPVGWAVAEATLGSTADRYRSKQNFGSEKYRTWVNPLTVDGTLQIEWPGGELDLAMDDASCYAEQYRAMQIVSSPKGAPNAKRIPNDLPENAEPISVGGSDLVRNTAGASPEPEAACTIMDPELGEPIELFISHTAWWTLEGTGTEVTVDTAGSSFDTVLGIYVLTEEGFAQVACVDDVFTDPDQGTSLAWVTFGTDTGVTYYIQAGGYAYSTGRLEIAVR